MLLTDKTIRMSKVTSDTPPTFGDWLRETRAQEKLSGVELEQRTQLHGKKVSRQFISDLERNVTNPKTGNVIKPSVQVAEVLAKALGRSPAEGRHAAGYTSPNETAPNSLRDFAENHFSGAEKLTDEDYVLVRAMMEAFIKTKLKQKE